MKKIVKSLLMLIMIFSILSFFSVKASNYQIVYLGGETIGLKIKTGVYVAGKYSVKVENEKVNPWEKTNIEVGDKIISINNININSNYDVLNYIENTNNSVVNLCVLRNDEYIKTDISVVKNSNGDPSIGLYIRDKVQGIGTITFKTNDNYFGSLGHGVYDNKVLLSVNGGEIYTSFVENIKKATPGVAGEKRARFENNQIGLVIKNDTTGLYGTINNLGTKEKITVASQEEIKPGKAFFYTVINGSKIEKFDIEIIKVNNQTTKSSKGIKFKVTDERLINATGGIVQGMSGSPIIQNGKLIGAISHVTVENPVLGYGMHINFMINEIEHLVNY